MPERRGLLRRGAWAFTRLVLLLACFALAYYAVDLLLIDDPSVLRVAIWFAGALVLHDFVLFPLYAGSDRILTLVLPRTRVPLINHVRIPVLGAGLSLLMFLPGILGQGTATHLAATGLDQEPYRERWVWLTVALFTVSAIIWLVRTVVAAISRRHDRSPVSAVRPRSHRRRARG